MSGRRVSRVGALLATATVLTSFGVWAGAGPASSTVTCTAPLQPVLSLTQTVLAPTATNPNVGYDELVTNTGTCGATNVTVTVRLPGASSFVSFIAVNRSWTCTVTATDPSTGQQTVTCLLGSQLDPKSTTSTGNSGKAEVIVYATPVAGGNKNAPPDTTEFAQVTDGNQPFGGDPSSQVAWAGVINPKTGGNLQIDQSTTIIKTDTTFETALVNIPAGVGAVVNLGQLTPTDCAPSGYPHPCNADLSINAPLISKGFSTITLTFVQPDQPPKPLFEEDTSSGVQPLLNCKGQQANPPCLYSFTQNSTKTAWVLVIHDAGGTKYYG